MLLDDSKVEQAWQLAVERGYPQPLWMALAGVREDEHPLDAVTVYKREVESLIDRKAGALVRASHRTRRTRG